jgi:5'(3')-deoxyribonucleotidase
MANPFNFIDFYIGYPGHPSFRNLELIEDDVVRVIIQKYEVVIFTAAMQDVSKFCFL